MSPGHSLLPGSRSQETSTSPGDITTCPQPRWLVQDAYLKAASIGDGQYSLIAHLIAGIANNLGNPSPAGSQDLFG